MTTNQGNAAPTSSSQRPSREDCEPYSDADYLMDTYEVTVDITVRFNTHDPKDADITFAYTATSAPKKAQSSLEEYLSAVKTWAESQVRAMPLISEDVDLKDVQNKVETAILRSTDPMPSKAESWIGSTGGIGIEVTVEGKIFDPKSVATDTREV